MSSEGAAPNVLPLPPEIEALDWDAFLQRWQWHDQPRLDSRSERRSPDVAAEERAEEIEFACAGPPDTRALAPVVRDAAQSRIEAARVAQSFVPGKGSLFFTKWPGVGGTTAFIRHAAESLAARAKGWKVGVAILSLPRRDLVEEKARRAREYVQERGLDVRVLVLLGRSKEEAAGWWCPAEQFAARATLHRELNRSSCVGCPARRECDETDGMYRHARAAVIEEIARAKRGERPPALVVTTHAGLPSLWSDLPKRVPIILDEAGHVFGLARELRVPWSEVDAARENALEFIRTAKSRCVTIQSELERRRLWSEAAHVRRAATERLRSSLYAAQDVDAAISVAEGWAGACDLAQGKARSLVEKHWPQRKKVVRALLGHLRSRDALPDLLVADLVARVLRMIQRVPVPPQKRAGVNKQSTRESDLEGFSRWLRKQDTYFRKAIRRLPEEYRSALSEGTVRPPRTAYGLSAWPWEEIQRDDGEDLRPAFASIAIDVARLALEKRVPVIQRKLRGVHIWLPDSELITRVRRGSVAWIAVGPIPWKIRDVLGIREEVVHADPDGLHVVVLGLARRRGWKCFGPGTRWKLKEGKRVSCPSVEDLVTRDLWSKFADAASSASLTLGGRHVSSVAAVLHRRDWDALKQPDRVRYYNAGHEGTDDLASYEMLLVRRWTPPFRECVLAAEILRRALDIPRPRGGGVVTSEDRSWQYGGGRPGPGVRTACLHDPLERDLQRFFELQGMLNAIGRCRPLSAGPEGRVVVFLNGRPLEGLRISEGPVDIPSQEFVDLFGFGVEVPGEAEREAARLAREERQAVRAVERQDRLLGLLEALAEVGLGRPSLRYLAARLEVSDRTVRRDLEELGRRENAAEARRVARIRAEQVGLLDALRRAIDALTHEGERGPGGPTREMSGGGKAPLDILMGAAPHPGHFGSIHLSESDLDLLPTASEVLGELSRGTGRLPSARTVRRHLSDIRTALRGEAQSLLSSRSDARRVRDLVLQACVTILDQRAQEDGHKSLHLEEPILPFGTGVAAGREEPSPAELLPSGDAPVIPPVDRGVPVEDVPLPLAERAATSTPACPHDGICDDCFEAFEERAAILEFDAGYPRAVAERRAWEMVFPALAVAS